MSKSLTSEFPNADTTDPLWGVGIQDVCRKLGEVAEFEYLMQWPDPQLIIETGPLDIWMITFRFHERYVDVINSYSIMSDNKESFLYADRHKAWHALATFLGYRHEELAPESWPQVERILAECPVPGLVQVARDAAVHFAQVNKIEPVPVFTV